MPSLSLEPTRINAKIVYDVPVLIQIKELCADEKRHVVHAYRYQDLVPLTVKWLVVVAIDLDCQFEIAEKKKRSSTDYNELDDTHTFDPITLLAWTHMLYSADATVLVLTDPAFRLVTATRMGCI